MWLRWRAKSSSSAGHWAWEHFPGPLRGVEPSIEAGTQLDRIIRKETRDDVEDFLAAKREENDWSEHSRGIEWKLFEDGYCPTWIVEHQLAELETNMVRAQERFTKKLSALSVEKVRSRGCPQCAEATPWEVTTKIGGYYRPCPYCGLCVLGDSMPFWIIPEDLPGSNPEEEAAFALLDSLVREPRSSKNRDANLIKPHEMRADQILIDRGLAGGSSGPKGCEEYATPRGKVEWEKHQKRKAKPKASQNPRADLPPGQRRAQLARRKKATRRK